ncbi:hypothetical protein AB0B51_32540, partial [Streptomyces griseus]
GLNIPTGIPLSYELDADFKPLKPGGTYLDPDVDGEPAEVHAEGVAEGTVEGTEPSTGEHEE